MNFFTLLWVYSWESSRSFLLNSKSHPGNEHVYLWTEKNRSVDSSSVISLASHQSKKRNLEGEENYFSLSLINTISFKNNCSSKCALFTNLSHTQITLKLNSQHNRAHVLRLLFDTSMFLFILCIVSDWQRLVQPVNRWHRNQLCLAIQMKFVESIDCANLCKLSCSCFTIQFSSFMLYSW